MQKLRVRKAHRRRQRRVELAPLVSMSYASDTTEAGELLDRIDQILKVA